MLCQFLLYSKVIQSYIYIYRHIHILFNTYSILYKHIYSFSHILFHHGLSQVIGSSSLWCPAGPHCLSILNGIVSIYPPQTPRLSHCLPLVILLFLYALLRNEREDLNLCVIGK